MTASSFIRAAFTSALICAALTHVTNAQTTYFGAAVLRGSYLYPQALGWITFAQSAPGQPTSVSVTISGGLPKGVYALHVHEYGDLTSGIGPNNISTAVAGTHFNPYRAPHGCDVPGSPTTKHVGDIGNVTVTADNAAVTDTFTSVLIDLAYSNRSIIGRAVIIHNSYDHCTQPTGDAGTPIIQGVVGIGHPFQNPYAPSSLPPPTNTTANAASLPLVASKDGRTDPNVQYGFSPTQSAVATLYPLGAPGKVQQAWGVVRFALGATAGMVDVTVTIRYLLPNTTHGFHVHLFGDDFDGSVPPYAPKPGTYSGTDHFANAGTHYNPYMEPHGWPSNATRHEGDLGNVTSDASGSVDVVLSSSLLDVLFWNTSIIGRAVIVHALPDIGIQPTGGAGDRILAGIIGLSSLPASANTKTDFTPYPTDPSSSGDNTTEEDEEYAGAAIAVILLLLVMVSVAMYVRFSYARYDKPCFACDCKGCVLYYCGKSDHDHEYRAAADDTAATRGSNYGALRD